MLITEKFYQDTLSLCEITEHVRFSEENSLIPNALTSEITHQIIEDSILLKQSVYMALYNHASLKQHFSLIRLAMILAKNLQSYLRGLEYDHAVNKEYLQISKRALRLYRRLLLANYHQWRAQLN
jgi:hypothetical protein